MLWLRFGQLSVALGRLNMMSGIPFGIWWGYFPKTGEGRFSKLFYRHEAAITLPWTGFGTRSGFQYRRLLRRLGEDVEPMHLIAFYKFGRDYVDGGGRSV